MTLLLAQDCAENGLSKVRNTNLSPGKDETVLIVIRPKPESTNFSGMVKMKPYQRRKSLGYLLDATLS